MNKNSFNKIISLSSTLVLLLSLCIINSSDALAATGGRRNSSGGGGGGGGGFIMPVIAPPAPEITTIETSGDSQDISLDSKEIVYSDIPLETDKSVIPTTIDRDNLLSIREKFEIEFGISSKSIIGKIIPRPIKLSNKAGNATLESSDALVIITESDSNTLAAPELERFDEGIDVKFVGKETKFLRPVAITVDVDMTDRSKLEIVNSSGEIIRNFDLSSDGTLTYRSNTISNFRINFIDPSDPTPLIDISDDPEYEAIVSLQERGIIQGHPNGTFRGTDTLIRAETSKIIAKLAGLEPEETSADEKWYVGYNNALKKAGIIQGHIDPITPENRANYLALIAKAKGINISKIPRGMKYFVDLDEDSWYFNLVSYAVVKGWLSERGGNFQPSALVDRSTAAGWASRAL